MKRASQNAPHLKQREATAITGGLRLGLCCQFRAQPVKFRTTMASATWRKREPLFHIPSPLKGWHGPKPERHHDYIDPKDFSAVWRGWPLTVEVEAKAKELAVAKLQRDLAREH
jgi:UV DNA damage endonuclease